MRQFGRSEAENFRQQSETELNISSSEVTQPRGAGIAVEFESCLFWAGGAWGEVPNDRHSLQDRRCAGGISWRAASVNRSAELSIRV